MDNWQLNLVILHRYAFEDEISKSNFSHSSSQFVLKSEHTKTHNDRGNNFNSRLCELCDLGESESHFGTVCIKDGSL